MKKIISILCAVAMLAACSCICASAEEPLITFTLVPRTMELGATELVVDLVANVAEGEDVTSFGVAIGYDSDAFVMKSAATNSSDDAIRRGQYVGSQEQDKNPYTWLWAAGTVSFEAGERVVATFTFDVLEGAVAGSEHEFTLVEDDAGVVMSSKTAHNYSKNGEVAFVGANVTIPEFIPGDVNGDSEYNTNDVICLIRCLAGWPNMDTESISASADMNKDGKFDEKDIIYYLRAIVGWEGYTIG